MFREAAILLTTLPIQVARPPVVLRLLEAITVVASLMIRPLVAVVTELVPEALTGTAANASQVPPAEVIIRQI